MPPAAFFGAALGFVAGFVAGAEPPNGSAIPPDGFAANGSAMPPSAIETSKACAACSERRPLFSWFSEFSARSREVL